MKKIEEQLAERLQFMKFDARSRDLLRELRPLLNRAMGAALEVFYAQVRATPQIRGLFRDDKHIDTAKRLQATHWDTLASAQFDEAYTKAVLTIGKTHARIGLEPRWYIGGYALMTDALIRALISDRESSLYKRITHSPAELGEAVSVLVRAVLIDMDLAISTYLDSLQESRQKAEETRAENSRQQMQALASFSESLSQMAAGNLMARLDSDLGPDFEDLKRDFNTTAEQLQNVIAAVLSSMRIIESGNSELAHASDDLARRTEQQAASLEQTTAALSQITEGVKTTTDGVAHARKVAETATKDAAHTSAVVSRSKVAMEEIQSATAKIGQITEVIDEIAFQTNLLALNAGVEAARAGDFGRGFAVVATEVRSLAQRASQSAKDIKVLIDHATTSVAEGATLVASTDDALARFVLQVKEINSIIGGIADTAQDQTTGLSEVNLAVGDLDRATQQNAAMVEEATAATQSLAQETGKLSQHLGFFKVAAGGVGHLARHDTTPAPAKERVRRVAGGGGKPAPAPAADGWTDF